MNHSSDILKSWEANAENLIKTVQNKELESRRLVTNKAIVNAVLDYHPKKVLDLGCGEGWLSRTLRKNGLDVYGADVVVALIEEARKQDGDYYWQYSYEEIIAGKHSLPTPFDAVVINFALFDKEVAEQLIAALPMLLNEDGLIFIQTIHPMSMAEQEWNKTGWKEENWQGMQRSFVLPYRWYYRTPLDWFSLFRKCGLYIEELREPAHPCSGLMLSMIFILRCK